MAKPNRHMDTFFATCPDMVTYGDVRLQTNYSDVLPADVRLDARFSRSITLGTPIVSAAMDTVTESEMAIAMAVNGGLGIIHKNMAPEEQAREVARVKHYLHTGTIRLRARV